MWNKTEIKHRGTVDTRRGGVGKGGFTLCPVIGVESWDLFGNVDTNLCKLVHFGSKIRKNVQHNVEFRFWKINLMTSGRRRWHGKLMLFRTTFKTGAEFAVPAVQVPRLLVQSCTRNLGQSPTWGRSDPKSDYGDNLLNGRNSASSNVTWPECNHISLHSTRTGNLGWVDMRQLVSGHPFFIKRKRDCSW